MEQHRGKYMVPNETITKTFGEAMKLKKYYMIKHTSEMRTFLDGTVAGVVLAATAWVLLDLYLDYQRVKEMDAEHEAWLDEDAAVHHIVNDN